MTQIGRTVWFDLFTQDIEKAKSFYSELFDWKVETMEMPGHPPYTMFNAQGQGICGVVENTDLLSNTWLSYAVVSNLEESLEKIKQTEGKVLEEIVEMPGVGKWAISQDPQGGIFAPFQPENTKELSPDIMPPLGHFCWHELMCNDYEKALSFYGNLFDWEKGDSIDMGEMGIYQMYNRNQNPMGGMMNIKPDMNIPQSTWVEYIHVENVSTTLEKAKSLGGQEAFPIMEVNDGGKIAGIIDNQGTMIAVWEPAS